VYDDALHGASSFVRRLLACDALPLPVRGVARGGWGGVGWVARRRSCAASWRAPPGARRGDGVGVVGVRAWLGWASPNPVCLGGG
jgi:hypothetical protein